MTSSAICTRRILAGLNLLDNELAADVFVEAHQTLKNPRLPPFIQLQCPTAIRSEHATIEVEHADRVGCEWDPRRNRPAPLVEPILSNSPFVCIRELQCR